MRLCPRCYKPIPFDSGFFGLAAHCGYCGEPLRGNRTSFAWVILAVCVFLSPPAVLGAVGRPILQSFAWHFSVSYVTVGILCLYLAWRTGEYVSPRRAAWPPERRDISRIFVKLARHSKVDDPKFAERERVLWDICRFAACFENRGLCGGLDEFLSNEPGNRALVTVEALEKVGAKNTAGFLRQACAFFPDGGPSTDQQARRGQMERMFELWGSHPMMEWAWNHPEYQETSLRLFFGVGDNLFAHLLRYWNEHPQQLNRSVQE
jgi:hypothetical protein